MNTLLTFLFRHSSRSEVPMFSPMLSRTKKTGIQFRQQKSTNESPTSVRDFEGKTSPQCDTMSKYACPYLNFESPDSKVSVNTICPGDARWRFPIFPLLTLGVFPSVQRPGGTKGLTLEIRDVAFDAGEARPLLSSMVRLKRSSPRPRNRVVSSVISPSTAGLYWRLAIGIDGGARKFPQKDYRLKS
jgi:hypothetical protein